MKFMPNIVKTDGYYDFIYGANMGSSLIWGQSDRETAGRSDEF
jgi:hypothetical protein